MLAPQSESKAIRQKIDLTDISYRAAPFEAFGRLRELGPVVPAKLPLIGKMWLITTYDAASEVLKNDKLFCRDPKNVGKRQFIWFQMMLPGLFKRLSQNMLAMDEPAHRRLRSLVDQAFQRQSITDMRPRIETLVEQQLDEVARVASDNQGVVDLIEHFCTPHSAFGDLRASGFAVRRQVKVQEVVFFVFAHQIDVGHLQSRARFAKVNEVFKWPVQTGEGKPVRRLDWRLG